MGVDDCSGKRSTERSGDPVAEVVDGCRAELARRGFVVVALDGDRTGWDWAHTVGLHRHLGHPELILAGLPAGVAASVVEVLAERVAEGARLDHRAGRRPLTVGPVAVRPAAVAAYHLAEGPWFGLGRLVLADGDPSTPFPPTLQLLWDGPTGTQQTWTDRPAAGERRRQPRLGDHPGALLPRELVGVRGDHRWS